MNPTNNWTYSRKITRPPEDTFFFTLQKCNKKKRSIRLIIFYSEVYLILFCKCFHCLQCYHRVILNNHHWKSSPIHLHQLRGWNRLYNLWRWKHQCHRPHHLRGWPSPIYYPLKKTWIKKFIKKRRYLWISKLYKKQAAPHKTLAAKNASLTSNSSC